MKNQAVNFAWADRLRILATIMVIAVHISGTVAEEYTVYDSWWWWAGNLYDSFGRAGVPLFVMLSGFLLLRRDEDLGVFIKKRLIRVGIPALFWMGVYSFYSFKAHGQPATLFEAFKLFIKGPVYYHLWFIYLIIGLYLLVPLIRPWVKTATERDYRYVFIVCMIGTWGYKIIEFFIGVKMGLYFEIFTNHMGYFILGYYLGQKLPSDAPELSSDTHIARWNLGKNGILLVGALMVAVGTLATAWGTYWTSLHFGGKFFPFFYDYLTPTVSIATIGWFLLLRHGMNNWPLLEVEKEFSAASFGIYLLHVLVMDWWSESGYWQSKHYPAKDIPLLIPMVALLTFLFVLILRKLPGGDKIT